MKQFTVTLTGKEAKAVERFALEHGSQDLAEFLPRLAIAVAELSASDMLTADALRAWLQFAAEGKQAAIAEKTAAAASRGQR